MHTLTDTERQAILDNEISGYITRGYRIEHTTQFSAVVARGGRTSHVLHLILSLLTFGAWVPVWIIMATINIRVRYRIAVDPYGHITRT